MEEGKVEVVVKGSASAPIKQTIAIVVNDALKEAGFTEVVLTHVVDGTNTEVRERTNVPTVLDMVAGTYPHLFTTPVGIVVEDEPAVETISVNDIGIGISGVIFDMSEMSPTERQILKEKYGRPVTAPSATPEPEPTVLENNDLE